MFVIKLIIKLEFYNKHYKIYNCAKNTKKILKHIKYFDNFSYKIVWAIFQENALKSRVFSDSFNSARRGIDLSIRSSSEHRKSLGGQLLELGEKNGYW